MLNQPFSSDRWPLASTRHFHSENRHKHFLPVGPLLVNFRGGCVTKSQWVNSFWNTCAVLFGTNSSAVFQVSYLSFLTLSFNTATNECLKGHWTSCICVSNCVYICCSGAFRPVKAESGEYLYCPPQRWLNNVHVSLLNLSSFSPVSISVSSLIPQQFESRTVVRRLPIYVAAAATDGNHGVVAVICLETVWLLL